MAEFNSDPEFKKLEELGFISEYVIMSGPADARFMAPMLTANQAIAQGFFPKGTKVRWIDHNGYPYQRDMAREKFNPEQDYTVKRCNIGRSSSTYTFEEIDGSWNSVMFERQSDDD